MADSSSKGTTLTLKVIKTMSKEIFGQANVISVPRALVSLTGDHVSAILLNQIIYWSERSEKRNGWFYKTADEWREELAISYSQIERALDKKLRKLGVETCVRKVGSSPKTHYRINHDTFGPLFLSFLENRETRKSENLKIKKANFSSSGDLNIHDFQESRKSMIKEAENTPEITHRHMAAPSQLVGVGSKFSLEECRRYAEYLKASDQGITNPGGYATTIFRSGEADAQIESFVNRGAPSDLNACPDCQGSGLYYADPANPDKGVVKCKHTKLAAAAS
jgi:DNA-binding transcriptional regulator GbsR (MarR family)